MADSFKFWSTYYEALKIVPSGEDRARLIMSLCGYVFEGVEPDFSDAPMLGALFEIMHEQALISKDIAAAARENGKRGGRPAGTKKKPRGKTPRLTDPKTEVETDPQKRSVACNSVALHAASGSASPYASATAGVAAADGVSESDMWYYERGLEPPRPAPPIGDGD